MEKLLLIVALGIACINVAQSRLALFSESDADGIGGDYHKDDEITPEPPTEKGEAELEALLVRHEELINKLLSAFQSGKVGIESLGARLQRLESIIQVALKVIESIRGENEEEGENGINPLSQLLRGVLEEVKEKYPGLDLDKILELFGERSKIVKRRAGRKMKSAGHTVKYW